MDYRLRPLAAVCAVSGETLEPGSECVSALIDEEGHFTRCDIAAAHWTEPPENCVGYWRSTVPQPQAKAKTLDAETLMERFEQLAEEDAPHQGPLVYVMALWLMRRRRLRLTGSEQIEGVDRLVLSGSGGEGPFTIREEQLSQADAEALQAQLFDAAPTPEHAEAA